MRKGQTVKPAMQFSPPSCFSWIGLTIILLLATPARAQVAAMVNGEPITASDIAHRIKLLEISAHKAMSKQEALEELIDEKIKLQTAKRQNIVVTDDQLNKTLAIMAQRAGRATPDFLDNIAKSGVDIPSYKTRLRSEMAWRQVLEQHSPGMFQVRDADLVAILSARGESPQTKAVQYSLQQIVLVVARGSPESARAARMKEAEALRSRSTSCEDALRYAREMRDVVIKDPMERLATDLATQYKKLLDSTPDGKMTPPEVTPAGIEVVAVCGRREIVADISSRREFREELLTRRLGEYEKNYLQELRKQYIISYR
jgi:peptidyl-prolyl cis-trans isomerase SurA